MDTYKHSDILEKPRDLNYEYDQRFKELDKSKGLSTPSQYLDYYDKEKDGYRPSNIYISGASALNYPRYDRDRYLISR